MKLQGEVFYENTEPGLSIEHFVFKFAKKALEGCIVWRTVLLWWAIAVSSMVFTSSASGLVFISVNFLLSS